MDCFKAPDQVNGRCEWGYIKACNKEELSNGQVTKNPHSLKYPWNKTTLAPRKVNTKILEHLSLQIYSRMDYVLLYSIHWLNSCYMWHSSIPGHRVSGQIWKELDNLSHGWTSLKRRMQSSSREKGLSLHITDTERGVKWDNHPPHSQCHNCLSY